MMKSTHFVFAALILASCGSDDYLGGNVQDATQNTTISFDGGTGKTSRATNATDHASRASMLTGKAAADKLGSKFVVFGTKTTGTAPAATVYDHYNVVYSDGTAHTTTSNSAGWEYVGIAPNVLNAPLSGTTLTQDIKYWDFGADRYDFIAFSTGEAEQQPVAGTAGDPDYPGTATADNVIVTPVDAANATTAAYTLTGATADLTKCYIADRVTATKTAATIPGIQYPYLAPIQFNFRPLGAKVRIGLYETIPGYSVKDVKFYRADDTYETTPLFFAGSECMPTDAATMTVKFPQIADPAAAGYNKAQVALQTIAGHESKDISLSALSTGFVTKENLEGGLDGEGNPIDPGTVFLGRSSNAATMNDYQYVVPTGSSHTLTLKMDYTLLSTDISKETITVRGATAVIPSEFCNWQPNTAYTYLFKISDNTSGWTNPTDPTHAGLYPVTLDALIAATEEGVQQTITLMAAPSITTYAKGDRVHEASDKTNYYEADDYNIYICLQPSVLTMTSSNVKMYKATATGSVTINESSVADVIKTGGQSGDPVDTYTKDDITVTTAGAPALTIVDAIPAADAPYDTAISGNFAVFKPTAAGTYVFEYTSPEEHYTYEEYVALAGNEEVKQSEFEALTPAETLKPNKHYKVIIVKEKTLP